MVKEVSVCLSRSEFNRLALEYNVLCEVKTCNVKISRSDFCGVSKKNENMTLTLSKSDFKNVTAQSAATKFITATQQDQKIAANRQYNFRERKRGAENISEPRAKRARTIIMRKDAKVPKLVVPPKGFLVEGHVVLAKMRTYAPWPAVIKSFRKTCVNVRFFGEDSTGNVGYGDIGLFSENPERRKKLLDTKRPY